MSYTASYIVNSSSAQGTTDFQFTFPYIKEEHIEVYLDYNKITQGTGSAQYQVITNVSPKLIRLNTGLASANLRVEVRRNSSLGSPLVDYADGSTLTANDLDTSALQSLYIDQELRDNQGKTVSVDEATGLPTLNNLRLTNVGDPTSAQDAATKNYVDTTAEPKSAKLTELATMAQNTANALADLTATEVQAIDGLTASTDELNKLDGVTATTAELNYIDGVTSNVQTQLDAKQPLDAELTELATMGSTTASALADLTQAEVQILDGATVSTDELNKLDGVTASTTEINKLDGVTASTAELNLLDGVTATTAELNKLDGVTATTDELNKTDGLLATPTELNTLDGITSNTSELNKLDGVTASTTELNIVAGKTFKTSSGTLDTTSDTEIPSSKVIAAHVASSQTAIGGFTTIADEVSFPNTQPATGVVVSINNAAGVVINSSGVSTSGKRLDNTTVTINGFPDSLDGETLAAGVGLIVVSTSTANTYNYHKILTSETDVKQLSDDINDFNSRYRIANSAPSSNNDEGDLYFDTNANKMKVYNGSAWDDVASVGSFFVNTLSGAGGSIGNSSGNFDGAAKQFTLSNPGTSAQQHIVSVNGVIQKPNAGTGVPSEGFAISGNDIIFSAAPASGSDFFIVTCGSSVSIGTPSANSVNSSHIIDGSIVDGDISSTANIAGSKVADDSIPEAKLDIHQAPSDGKFLKYTSSNGMEWGDVPAGVGGSNGVDFNDDVKARFGTGNDLEIYHASGSNSTRIENTAGSGDLFITNKGSNLRIQGNAIYLENEDATQNHLKATNGGSVELNYSGSKKLETTNTGATITGVCTATSFSGSGANLTNLPPAGNTIDLVADGAIAAGKPVIITTAGKAAQVKETSTPRTSPSDSNLVSGYSQSVDMIGEHAKIAYDDDNNFYVVVYKRTNNNLVCQIGTINANESVGWSSENEIQGNQNFTNLGLCYAGNSRFVLVYRNGTDSKSYVRIGKLTDGNTISWSSTNYVDGLNGSIYNDPRPVKIATDRVAIVCRRSGGTDGKWTDGRLGVIVGDVTSDTAWTYRSHLELSSHEAHADYVDSAYNSTDDVTFVVWKKINDTGHCRAFKVASGTSATITSSSETAFESGNDMANNKTVWHSGQNKFISTFTRGGYDDIRSKISTVTIAGNGTISISVGSAIDLSGTNPSLAAHWALELGVTSTGAVWCFWIRSGGGFNNRLRAICDDDFNGSTLAWSSSVNVAAGYNDYFYSIDGLCNHEHSNRFILFSENYSDQPTYFAFQTETISTNVTNKNCIGFANSAISDGNTGTIALNGNLATGQSGLTPATRYWVKGDGTLQSTGKATAEIHLLATASDKGLIQVKTDWTSN